MDKENKQGINDNTTNSNNTDVGNDKNNRSTEKNIDKSKSINIIDNKAPIKIDQSKKSFSKKIVEKVKDNYFLFFYTYTCYRNTNSNIFVNC